jgi:hypothetical protein
MNMKRNLMKALMVIAVSGLLVAPAAAADYKSEHKMAEKTKNMKRNLKKMSGDKGDQFK